MIRQKREVNLLGLDEVVARLPQGMQSSLNLKDFPSNSRGRLPPVTHGVRTGLRRVIFNVINFSDIIGTGVTRSGNSSSRNRLTLRWDSWEVVLDAAASIARHDW